MASQSALSTILTTYRTALAAGLVFLGGAAVVCGAWGFQLIGGYVPCKLCLEQRVPYYVGLPIALLAFIIARFAPARTGIARLALVVFALLMIYGGGIGVYQAGAEWTFWPGPTDCGGGGSLANNAGNLLNSLQNLHVVSCTEASWRMFGLSFAGWNVVASAGLAIVALWGAIAKRG
ncbi:disulfide bond formation protein DsbB [Breoghania corrubedonensis]|uniref:Disulfide bond formation protein DsbB n=1 Tax=Breoghania corrubedonensis TaxID=665038 RepID=A0A2T5V5Q0_9HYPH|nr:disulfide bond formation protein B [Breoghania corrubedonensis]PTW59078.1 disulfide bond formation protein DsbB [Breoghania corrubedonensis]